MNFSCPRSHQYFYNIVIRKNKILLCCHEKCVKLDIVNFYIENFMYIDFVIIILFFFFF